MNKLSRKFIGGVGLILCLATILSALVNARLAERYYIHEKRAEAEELCDRLEAGLDSGMPKEEVIGELEDLKDVAIVRVGKDSDTDILNENLRRSLADKGIGFQRFWLWEEDYKAALKDGRRLRIYHQEKLNYSIMAAYVDREDGLYALAMILPDMKEAVGIMNMCTTAVLGLALLSACAAILFLVRRITRPLEAMRRQADEMAAGRFTQVDIHTGDELEVVARSMNRMGRDLEEYQKKLMEKNRQMEQLLNDVAHELKTPVALVKVYAQGMKDGLDDGTFLDTIMGKNQQMGDLVEKLLLISRIQDRELAAGPVELDELIRQELKEQALMAAEGGICFRAELEEHASVRTNREMTGLIVSNLISNAVKYTTGPEVDVSLKASGGGYIMEIRNDAARDLDISQIWNPFYVGEESRSKHLSGTGLGLTMVRRCAERMGCQVSCRLEEGSVWFEAVFKDAGNQADAHTCGDMA